MILDHYFALVWVGARGSRFLRVKLRIACYNAIINLQADEAGESAGVSAV
jgi:hypothetical protein